jgi:hypothetical protein
MMHKIFKSTLLFALTFFFMESASAQSRHRLLNKNPKITIDLNNIEFNVAKALKTVAVELKSFDFERIGAAFEIVGRDIDREFGDIDLEVIDENHLEYDKNNLIAEKTKLIVKSYLVDKDDKLAINNQYGKVLVHTWPKNEIKVEIEIKAIESTEQSATQLLESVNISESRNANLISFKTNFEKISANFRSLLKSGKEDKRRLQVTYIVYMPAKNPLDINNSYGNIEMDDFAGPLNIISTYGSFSAGKIDHPQNQVKVTYGSANIANFSNGSLSITYGNLKLIEGDKLNATIKYSNAKIGHIRNGGDFNLAYSSGFKIDAVDKSVKNLTINSAYSSLTLGFDEAADFDFDVTVSYAGFNYTSTNSITISDLPSATEKSKGWNPTKNFKGQIGKGSDSRIIIKSSYGAVKFL